MLEKNLKIESLQQEVLNLEEMIKDYYDWKQDTTLEFKKKFETA